MNRQNIISAGKMIAIVVALLGAMFCGAALTPFLGQSGVRVGDILGALVANSAGGPTLFGVAPLCYLIFGALLIVCGLVLLTTFGGAERRPALAIVILVFGSLVALLGLLAITMAYRNPFSWMIAIVGVAIFIDALCLKISLASRAAK